MSIEQSEQGLSIKAILWWSNNLILIDIKIIKKSKKFFLKILQGNKSGYLLSNLNKFLGSLTNLSLCSGLSVINFNSYENFINF